MTASGCRRFASSRARQGLALLLGALWLGSCDDTIEPEPPKQGNQPPETFLAIESDSLAPQLYRLRLSWLGSDSDGSVASYRFRWTCEPGQSVCLVDTVWQATQELSALFLLPVPDGTARYVFQVAAVDNDGAPDPGPAQQAFDLYNTAPVVAFAPGSVPQTSLPAVTFYLDAADPDTTANQDDGDSQAGLDHYQAWLDGAEEHLITASVEDGAVTLREADFGGLYGPRTIFVQAVDSGQAVSATIQHTWEVQSVPENGILLVDDCRMGGNLERVSDNSWRNVLTRNAPERTRVLDIEALPRLSGTDLEATLSLFDQIIWYTDADTLSSGALQLGRESLLALIDQGGKLVLGSGLVFGTKSAFEDMEPVFRERFGIETVFASPTGGTNFSLSQQDTVQAAVHPGLTQLTMRSLGLRPIMECFRSAGDAAFLYYYPPSTLVRDEFANPERFDIGVSHENPGGGRTAYVSFPLGLPINTNSGENETEIQEILRLVGILP
jgi:hypothetical protein